MLAEGKGHETDLTSDKRTSSKIREFCLVLSNKNASRRGEKFKVVFFSETMYIVHRNSKTLPDDNSVKL